jgi:hypothetical protein
MSSDGDINVTCPKCGKISKAPPGSEGKKATCKCGAQFLIHENAQSEPVASANLPPPIPSRLTSSLMNCPDCGRECSRRASACPHCGCPLSAPPTVAQGISHEPKKLGRPVKRTSVAGAGCFMQGLGIVAGIGALITIPTVIGPIVLGVLALWLLVYGSNQSQWYECSECGTKLARQKVASCPSCNASLSK